MTKLKKTAITFLIIGLSIPCLMGMANSSLGGTISAFIKGANGNKLDIESNGSMPVSVQDQTSPAIDLYFVQASAAPTTIATQVAIGDTDIDVVASVAAGTYVGIFCPSEGRFFFADVLAVAGAGPYTITVDTPSDFAFGVGDNVLPTTRDMVVDGTLAAPEIFEIQGPGGGDTAIDITRLMFAFTCTAQPDDSLFADIAALTNGLVIRRKDGVYRNIANIKSNSEFANLAYDIVYTNRTTPASTFGVRIRWSFGGQDKHGVVIRLATGESLQLLIQDPLTTGGNILSFRAIAVGHEVVN